MVMNSDREYLISVKYVVIERFHVFRMIISWINIKFNISMDYLG